MDRIKVPMFDVCSRTVPNGFESVQLHEIDLNITNRCNLNCIHCAFASNIGDSNELPFEIIREIVNDAKELGCEDIHLTGGEPTLHREFDRVLDLVIDSGLFPRLISNGTMALQNLRRYRQKGLTHVLFSVDGLESTHDRIRRRHRAFRKTMNRIRDALDLEYHVRVNAVAMRDNLDGLGVHVFSIFLYSPTGRNAGQQRDLIVDPYAWRRFKGKLKECSHSSPVEVVVEKGFLFKDEPEPDWRSLKGRGGGCHYLSMVLDYLIITGDGSVYPCALLNDKDIPYGNIRQRSLREIIERPSTHYLTYQSFQEPAEKCESCREWQRCHGGCRAFAYAFKKAWGVPDPQCQKKPDEDPSFIPLCPLLKENLQEQRASGFSEKLSR
jgi:radical SAM protein with 4Fe4S-binding SPASM domain